MTSLFYAFRYSKISQNLLSLHLRYFVQVYSVNVQKSPLIFRQLLNKFWDTFNTCGSDDEVD